MLVIVFHQDEKCKYFIHIPCSIVSSRFHNKTSLHNSLPCRSGVARMESTAPISSCQFAFNTLKSPSLKIRMHSAGDIPFTEVGRSYWWFVLHVGYDMDFLFWDASEITLCGFKRKHETLYNISKWNNTFDFFLDHVISVSVDQYLIVLLKVPFVICNNKI